MLAPMYKFRTFVPAPSSRPDHRLLSIARAHIIAASLDRGLDRSVAHALARFARTVFAWNVPMNVPKRPTDTRGQSENCDYHGVTAVLRAIAAVAAATYDH